MDAASPLPLSIKTENPGSVAEENSADDNARTRGNHSKHAVTVLKGWLFSEEHVHHPYPTEQEKAELMS